jgi:hypothetical protein
LPSVYRLLDSGLMRALALLLWALCIWPLGLLAALRARRRLRAYRGDGMGAFTLRRVA